MWQESGVVQYDEIAFRGLKHYTKMKFFIKDFFSKCADLVIFTKEILNGKLHFLCKRNFLEKYILLL